MVSVVSINLFYFLFLEDSCLMFLIFNILRVNSAVNKLMIVFLSLPRKQGLTFLANCLLRRQIVPKENLHEISILFSEKIKY